MSFKQADRSSSLLESVGKLKLEYSKMVEKAIAANLIDEDINALSNESLDSSMAEKKDSILFSEMGTRILLKWDSINLTELDTESPIRLLRAAQIQKLLHFCNTMDQISGNYSWLENWIKILI